MDGDTEQVKNWNSPCFLTDNRARAGHWETGSAGLRPPPDPLRSYIEYF
jgi:hypothetical protein